MKYAGLVDFLRFHTAVIPNPRAFRGVRDLLFGLDDLHTRTHPRHHRVGRTNQSVTIICQPAS